MSQGFKSWRDSVCARRPEPHKHYESGEQMKCAVERFTAISHTDAKWL